MEFAPPKSLLDLYLGFLSIGARSFGGVLPWAHRVMVEEKRWVAPADFAEVLALCQFLPGPNVGNVSVVLGRRWFGPLGAFVAFTGLMALPLVWVFGLALLYADYSSMPAVKAVVTGVGIAGGGLFIGTALKLARPLARKPWGVALAVACFGIIALGRVSLFAVLPAAALIGWLAARKDLV
ncbi:MAG TPA: chromate transporter [Burkholderiales bacterium]|nr:chromate transporter [Burkholderiales bacterium]